MKNKILILIYIILISCAIAIVIVAINQRSNIGNNKSLITDIKKINNSLLRLGNISSNNYRINKSVSSDDTFYLENGKLYVKDNYERWRLVDGDFSKMRLYDYPTGTYQSKPNIGGVYFYYEANNGDIYYTRSENYTNWEIKNLTTDAEIPKHSKIKYIRVSGTYGLIFYIKPGGEGEIITSTTQGKYWDKMYIDCKLDENSQVMFLNDYGMCVDGFIRVPNSSGKKCDIYMCRQLGIDEFKKVNIPTTIKDKSLDYYFIPKYGDNGMTLFMQVGKDKNDYNLETFVLETGSQEWITEKAYKEKMGESSLKNDIIKESRNKKIDELDRNVFAVDIENYNPDSNKIIISQSKAKEIAEIGFKESAERIAGEGTENESSETIKIDEVNPNNYFIRKTGEYDYINFSIKRNAYVVTRKNDIGNGVSIYVDAATGLIIGGEAFGD